MLRRLSILLLSMMLFAACGKDNRCTVSIGVTNFVINPNSAGDWAGLNNVGGYAYATGGHRGVVIVRTGLNDFVAFERTCPEDNTSRVEVSAGWGSSLLECPTCHSRFVVENFGLPTDDSPTDCPLYQYSTSYSAGELYVY